MRSPAAALGRLSRDPGLRRAVLIVAGLRVGLGLAAWLGLALAPAAMIAGRPLPAPATGLAAALIDPWQRWDSWHFEGIAASGYGRGSLEVAFLPLYPVLIRLVATVLGGAWGLAALMVSTVAAVAGLTLLHHRVASDVDGTVARRTVLYLGVAPTALFLVAPYSEAIFLAVSVGAFSALRSRRFGAAAALISAACLIRPQGLILIAAAAVEVWAEVRDSHRQGSLRVRLTHLAVLIAPVATFSLWLAWTQARVGLTPLAAEAQGWGSHFAWPWQGLVDGLASTGVYPGPIYNAATVLVWLGLLSVLRRRRDRVPLSYTVYAGASLIPIVFREEGFGNPWASAPRFAFVVFPLFVALALLTERRPRVHAFLSAASAALAVVAIVVFTHNQFVA